VALSPVVQPGLLADRVFDTIHAAIMSGDLPAGTQLKVRDIADQVQTSVMPVREAIRRLEESGLAVREPHKGAVVKSLSMTELVHTYEVRTLLEVEAARLGGTNITAADCAVMRDIYGQLEIAVDKGDVVASLNCDEAMLTVLYQAGSNPVLMEIIRGLWQRCRPYKIRGAHRAHDQADRSLWEFQPRLIEAAAANDADKTAEITRESMIAAKVRIGETFAADGDDVKPIS
jgi:DNA-binding GntR family transcriptional regulator